MHPLERRIVTPSYAKSPLHPLEKPLPLVHQSYEKQLYVGTYVGTYYTTQDAPHDDPVGEW